MASQTETIASIVTPPGLGGISMITLNGPASDSIIDRVFVAIAGKGQMASNSLRLGHLTDQNAFIDEILLCRRNDSYDINIHGGPVAARQALDLLSVHGATITHPTAPYTFNPIYDQWNNPAIGQEMLNLLPGINGPIATGMICHQWSNGLSRLVRTAIDDCHRDLKLYTNLLRKAAERLPKAELLLRGPEIVIAGPPNAGKSMLTNALTQKEACIVTNVAGTTRDWIRETALINGVGVWITDTAGLWDAQGHIDTESVARAEEKITHADLAILLQAADSPGDIEHRIPTRQYLRVASKSDLGTPDWEYDIAISVIEDSGITALADAILEHLGLLNFDPEEPIAFTRRQAELLEQAAADLENNNVNKAENLLLDILQTP